MNKVELLGPLGKDTTKLVLDRLPPQDQWCLATSSGSIYRLFGQLSQKSIVYSFSVIPEGALEHSIFNKYAPNYFALIKFLRIRARHQKFIVAEFPFFDYEDVWPLLAIMGNEAALRELIGKDPKRRDINGKCALDYLAFCGHKTVLINWINDFYPGFSPKDAPSLHFYAALGGSEEPVFMLVEQFGYDINDSGRQKGWSTVPQDYVTLLHAALWGKHTALLRRLVIAGGDIHKSEDIHDHLALQAAEMSLWEFHEEFFALETKVESANFNNKLRLYYEAAVCSNKRDKLEEFKTKRADTNTGDYYHEPAGTFKRTGEYLGHAAIRSGQIELLDWSVDQGWVNIHGVFASIRRCVAEEDKHPALFVAAIHGQLKMFDHLVEKYGLDPLVILKGETVLNWMIATTTWSNFEYIAQKYFHDIDLLTPDEAVRPPLADAIQSGALYNAQQYIKKYFGDENFLEYANPLIALAEECNQPLNAKWLKFKLASLRPVEVQSNIVEEVYSDPDQYIEIVMLGDNGTGKTALMRAMDHQPFVENLPITRDPGFLNNPQPTGHDPDPSIPLRVVEVPAHHDPNRADKIRRQYLGSADAVLICFDTSEQTSFEDAKSIHRSIQTECPERVQLCFVGTKADLPKTERSVSQGEILQYAETVQARYVSCSAKTGQGVEQVFEVAKSQVLESRAPRAAPVVSPVVVEKSKEPAPPKKLINFGKLSFGN